MGRKGSKVHRWTDDELKLLLEVVKDASKMLEHYKRQGYTQTDWWASVSGILFAKGGPVVTGKACARQFDLWMNKQGPESIETDDAWLKVSNMVDVHEQSLLESIDERLDHVEKSLEVICHVVNMLARELGVKETWE